MRKIIIDTDTGSDDAAALVLACFSGAEIVCVTTVNGNVGVDLCTKNAIATLGLCKKFVPVYSGERRPIECEREMPESVHGKDGLGDCGLAENVLFQKEEKNAVDAIIDTVKEYPYEIEILALGPATNIAKAIAKDRETMKKVKRIWSMGTTGHGEGNASPVAEFNVFIDAHAYAVMLESEIPLTIIGLDLCTSGVALYEKELEKIKNGNKLGNFIYYATGKLAQFYADTRGEHRVDLPDAIAAAVMLWEDIVIDSKEEYCYCCTKEEMAYGQVILFDPDKCYEGFLNLPKPNANVIRSIDEASFKERLLTLFTKNLTDL